MKTEYLSTGKAAALFSVTASAVLKWIKSGKIPANRTAGGHYRISKNVVLSMAGANSVHEEDERNGSTEEPFQYCWEFKAKSGEVEEGCRDCVVYKARVGRCYEMSGLPSEAGHARLFCSESCKDCDYYKMVLDQQLNVLVVTDHPALRESLLSYSPEDLAYNLRFTDCEYKCSMLVENYCPDYVVLDCSMGADRSREFALNLSADPRIPFVRVILAGKRSEFPNKCDKLVFAYIVRPFTGRELQDLIGNTDRRPESAVNEGVAPQ